MFPAHNLDYDAIYLAYKTELTGLSSVLGSSKKMEYLSRISNYNDFKKMVSDKGYKKIVSKLIKSNPIIEIGTQSEILTDILLTAHLAVCCELLEKTKVPLAALQPGNIDFMLDNLLADCKKSEAGNAYLKVIDYKMHSIDAFRTIQILRGLGLYTRESEDVTQLSLGVGSGSKDLNSVHLEPELKILPDNSMEFHVKQLHAKDIVLVDGDPQRKELFNTMNDNQEYPIVAINDSAFGALESMNDTLRERGLAPRNTVIALRIDHRMIPDVTEFFRLLVDSIDSVADLIVTIGSGFDMGDFTGRTEVIQNMYDFLKKIGLRPVLLKLHGKGTLEEQWGDHAFGLKNITTYQILYCKLKKGVLKKQLNNFV